MTGFNQRIHLADVGCHIGRTCKLPGVSGVSRLSGHVHAGLHMIVGLDRAATTLAASAPVRIWSGAEKVSNLRPTALAGRSLEKVGVVVPAAELAAYVGRLAFLDGGAGKGPHIVLAVRTEGEDVQIEFSADELVGTVDKTLELSDET